MGDSNSEDYWEPRDCLREPTQAILSAAEALSNAVGHHLKDAREIASTLMVDANTSEVRNYNQSLWGSPKRYPEQVQYLRERIATGLPARLPNAKDRMPSRSTKLELIERDGYICHYCILPVIPAEVRKRVQKEYPSELPWGTTNLSQHAAFQALWLQYDHVIPASYGGNSELGKMVVSCAGCNFVKWHYHLAELGVMDPRQHPPRESTWVGLTNYADGNFV